MPQKNEAGSLILITAGGILVLTALLLVLFSFWTNHQAGKASDAILRILEKEMVETMEPAQEMEEAPEDVPPGEPLPVPALRVNGYDCIGILVIPSLGIRLPVLAEWDDTRLKTAPCLYSGSWQEDNMVICGHNYRRHFAPVKSIRAGADVFLETVDGQMFHYVVRRRETVNPTAISAMIDKMEDPGNRGSIKDWDLTLFTCNAGGRSRCAVRCIRS